MQVSSLPHFARPSLHTRRPVEEPETQVELPITRSKQSNERLNRFGVESPRTPSPSESAVHLPERATFEKMRMVHIGLGAFFQGHIATYFNDLEKVRPLQKWSLSAGNIRSDARELAAQRGMYTLETVSSLGDRIYSDIKSIKRVIRRSPGASKLISAGAKPNVGIISCTISPGGYHYNATNELDMTAPAIKADLAGGSQTIYGVISAMLEKRHSAGRNPLAILSCDNIPQNGTRFRAAMLMFLSKKLKPESEFYRWTEGNITFPNSMVDRITPKPDEALMARVAEATGFQDKKPVMVEQYKNWIIEENEEQPEKSFPAGRPAFEAVGVKMVKDVQPFEEAKVRILNASHAAVAWYGAARAKATIHEALDDKAAEDAVSKFLHKAVIPAIRETIGQDLDINLQEYAKTTVARFKNKALCDQVSRVGRKGSAKIATQILPTVRQLISHKENFKAALIPVALHYRFVQTHFSGKLKTEFIETEEATKMLKTIFSSADPLTAYCAEPKLFGDLAGQAKLVSALKEVVAEVGSRPGASLEAAN